MSPARPRRSDVQRHQAAGGEGGHIDLSAFSSLCAPFVLFILFIASDYTALETILGIRTEFIQFLLFLGLVFIPLAWAGVGIYCRLARCGFPVAIWQFTPTIAMTVGLALTVTTLVPAGSEQSGAGSMTIFENTYEVIHKAAIGIVASIITFIGISIWIFIEQITTTSNEMQRQLDRSAKDMSAAARRSFYSIGKLANSARFISLFQNPEQNDDSLLERVLHDKKINASLSISENLEAWEQKFYNPDGSDAPSPRQLLWLNVMETYFVEERYDISRGQIATNTRNYVYIIASILSDIMNVRGEYKVHYYAKCVPTVETMFPDGGGNDEDAATACSAAELFNIIKFWLDDENSDMVFRRLITDNAGSTGGGGTGSASKLTSCPIFRDNKVYYYVKAQGIDRDSAVTLDSRKIREDAGAAWERHFAIIQSAYRAVRHEDILSTDESDVMEKICRLFNSSGAGNFNADRVKAFYDGDGYNLRTLAGLIRKGPNIFRRLDTKLGLDDENPRPDRKVSLYNFLIGVWSFHNFDERYWRPVEVVNYLFGKENVRYYDAGTQPPGEIEARVAKDYAIFALTENDAVSDVIEDINQFKHVLCITTGQVMSEGGGVGSTVLIRVYETGTDQRHDSDARAQEDQRAIEGMLHDFCSLWNQSSGDSGG